MATRDEFEITITCPKCGHSGTAEVSENDYPFMKHFQVDKMPDGFELARYAKFRNKTEYKCKCGMVFSGQ